MVTQLLPWATCFKASQPFQWIFFPNIQPQPPLAQHEAISSCTISCCLGKETNTHFAITSFKVVLERNTVDLYQSGSLSSLSLPSPPLAFILLYFYLFFSSFSTSCFSLQVNMQLYRHVHMSIPFWWERKNILSKADQEVSLQDRGVKIVLSPEQTLCVLSFCEL